MKQRNTLVGGLLGGLLLASSAFAQTLVLGSTPQGSAAYATAATISKVIVENGGPNIQLIPEGGPHITLPMLSAGELDLSVGAGTSLTAAVRGIGEFDGRKLDNVRLVGVFFDLTVGVFVPADSEIRSLEDLEGKRLPGGFPQQKILDQILIAILATAGLTQDAISIAPVANGTLGIDELLRGRVDAAVFSVTAGKTLEANTTLGGIRWLPLADTEATREVLSRHAPGSRVTVLEPSENMPGISEPTPIYADPFVLVASAGTADDVIYNVTRILYEHADKLRAENASMRGFDPAMMAPDLGVPYHDGAAKFYGEAGLMP